ncbi:MAG: hypothetical protein IID05_13635 [Gemmatimonadetes bacterium]|nr:hypothetical protein [Gemmatimonadota bacterium]
MKQGIGLHWLAQHSLEPPGPEEEQVSEQQILVTAELGVASNSTPPIPPADELHAAFHSAAVIVTFSVSLSPLHAVPESPVNSSPKTMPPRTLMWTDSLFSFKPSQANMLMLTVPAAGGTLSKTKSTQPFGGFIPNRGLCGGEVTSYENAIDKSAKETNRKQSLTRSRCLTCQLLAPLLTIE